MMTFTVVSWWSLLCTIAVFNIAAWSLSAIVLQRRQGILSAEAYAIRKLQLVLSAMYVFGCAYRSVILVYDVPRIVMVDSWLSSVLIGRSVATLAEVCFVAQLALVLRDAAISTGSNFARRVSFIVVPLIGIAETFSWYSVLTTSNIGHVVEESIWGLSAALIVASLVAMWPRCRGPMRYLLDVGCILGIAYVAFMFLVDVPMYWSRWIADEAHGRPYLTVLQGLQDVSGRWTVSHRWEDWRHEVAWMTLYFSVAVWFSISLIHSPVARTQAAVASNKRLSTAA